MRVLQGCGAKGQAGQCEDTDSAPNQQPACSVCYNADKSILNQNIQEIKVFKEPDCSLNKQLCNSCL